MTYARAGDPTSFRWRDKRRGTLPASRPGVACSSRNKDLSSSLVPHRYDEGSIHGVDVTGGRPFSVRGNAAELNNFSLPNASETAPILLNLRQVIGLVSSCRRKSICPRQNYPRLPRATRRGGELRSVAARKICDSSPIWTVMATRVSSRDTS